MGNITDKKLKNKEQEDLLKELNFKIMQVTTEIKTHYPELTKFLKDKPKILPSEQNMDVILKDLTAYYDSLNSVVNSYITEQA